MNVMYFFFFLNFINQSSSSKIDLQLIYIY
jgi:hypothetical protein